MKLSSVVVKMEGEETKEKQKGNEENEKEVKWVNDYSSNHQILLVGEGDFSFSLSLALAFGSAHNIFASSLDSYGRVTKKYKKARTNLETLKKMGASILHEVDATRMKHHPDLRNHRFDRIIFNFPHAGFHGREDNHLVVRMHRKLVRGFFTNASRMLRHNGEVHVSHKTTGPFRSWNLEELARQGSLSLIDCVDFRIQNYPSYRNKRGGGRRCDEPFPLGKCSTFKFRVSRAVKRNSGRKSRRMYVSRRIRIQKQENVDGSGCYGICVNEFRADSRLPVPVNSERVTDHEHLRLEGYGYPERTRDHLLGCMRLPLTRDTDGGCYSFLQDNSSELTPRREDHRMLSRGLSHFSGSFRVTNHIDREPVRFSSLRTRDTMRSPPLISNVPRERLTVPDYLYDVKEIHRREGNYYTGYSIPGSRFTCSGRQMEEDAIRRRTSTDDLYVRYERTSSVYSSAYERQRIW